MIPLYKVFMPQEIENGLRDVLFSGQISYGRYAIEFEEKLRMFINNPLLITVSTSNYALHIAFDILDLKPGDEVISSPMSCLATNQPVLTNKLKIVWADIDPNTGTLNPEDVRKKITGNTKAILHYHWCGYPGYIDEINSLGKEYGLYVVEDATESFGAKYKNKYIGNTGTDIVCFSFSPVRLPNCIEGGAIAFNSENLYQKALLMRDYGIDRRKFRDKKGEISEKCDISIRGYGAMLNNINGFIGSRQMEYINDLLDIQFKNGIYLSKLLSLYSENILIDGRADIIPNYWVYSYLVKNKLSKLDFYRSVGIYSSFVHLRNDIYTCFEVHNIEKLKGVQSFSERVISIPSGWWVSKKTYKTVYENYQSK